MLTLKDTRHIYSRIQPYVIFSMASLFYLYDFVQRVLPSAAANSIAASLKASPMEMGFLASMFFYGYVPMQIIAGILLDAIGPKKLMTLGMFICTLATFAFANTDSYIVSYISRFFTGISMSFAYIGVLLLISRWLPGSYFAFTVGIVQLMGSLGAIAGEKLLAKFTVSHGWQTSVNWVAWTGLLFTVLLFLIIRDYPKKEIVRNESLNKKLIIPWKLIKVVIWKPQTWWIGIYSFFCWAPITIFASFWGIPFLTLRYHTDINQAATLIISIWVGIAIGGPVLGWWSKYISRRKPPLIFGSICGLFSILVVLYIPILPFWIILVALFFFGVSGSAQAVTFGVVRDINLPAIYATAAGINNMAIVAGGLVLLPLVGIILSLESSRYFKGVAQNLTLSLHDYHMALVVLPICSLLGLLVAMGLVKETYCKQTGIQ